MLVALGILLSVVVFAAAENNAAVSDNLGNQNYFRWSSTVKSYLVSLEDGAFLRVESIGHRVVAEKYSSKLKLVNSFSIENELPLFGGFYESPDSFFLVFGQKNLKENDSTEVIRVVRYDKSWRRIGAASLYGANTRIPFEAGSLRMAHSGDVLYIRTCHEMYRSTDGFCHQANLMLSVSISEMEITDSFYKVWNISGGYVSHSFNQFVAVDGNKLLAVDHGDAHPRAGVLIRYGAEAGEEKFSSACDSVNVFPIAGAAGDNDTGVSIGGFEVSDGSYLIAGNSSVQNPDGVYGIRNIFVAATSKSAFSAEKTQITWITDYQNDDADAFVQVSTPHFVAVEDGFLLLWTVKGQLNYVLLDNDGTQNGNIMTAEASLSDCKPVYAGGAVYWYCTNNSGPIFYRIDMKSPKTVEKLLPEKQEATEPTQPIGPTQPTEATQSTEPKPEAEHDCPGKAFLDVPGTENWAHEGIDFALRNGLFLGTSKGTFEPDTPMTRAMLVTVLWRSAGMSKEGTNAFSDVPEGTWYTEAVKWASACDIVNGIGNGRFDPQGNITREQMAAILYRFAKHNQKDVSEKAALSSFADALSVSDWAKEAMSWSVAEGIINGVGEHGMTLLMPQGNATRAQVATILMRYLQR